MQRLYALLNAKALLLVLGLVALLPVFFVPVPWITLAHAKILLVVLFVFAAVWAWASSRLMSGQVTLPKSSVLGVAILLPIAYAVSAFFASGSASFVGTGVERDTAVAMLLWTLGLVVAAVTLTSSKWVLHVYRGFIAAAAVLGVLHLLRLLIGPEFLSLGGLLTAPAASLVGSWHDLGIFLGLTLVLTLGFASSHLSRGIWRWVAYVALASAFVVLVIVNAQDVWVALAVLSVLAAGYFWWIGRTRGASTSSLQEATPSVGAEVPGSPDTVASPARYPRRIFVYLALAVVAVGFAFGGSAVTRLLPSALQVGQVEVRPSWEGTVSIVSSVFREQNMIFGSGPNTFNRQWSLYKPLGVNETAFWNVSFSYGVGFIPTAVVTVGLLGAIVWVLFLLAFAVSGVRSLFRSSVDREWRTLLFALVVGTGYLWVMHIVYPPGITVLALTFLLTGVCVAAQAVSRGVGLVRLQTKQGLGFLWVIALIVMMLLALGTAFLLGRAVVADMLVNRSISTFNRTSDAAAAEQYLVWATQVRPGYDRALRAGVELNLIRFAQLSAATEGNPTERQQQLQQAIQAAIQNGLAAAQANSASYQNWLTVAGVYHELVGAQVAGAYENARAAYERAIEQNPTNPEPYLLLARLAILQNDLDTAKGFLDEAIARKQNYAVAYLLLSQLEVTRGNLDAALVAAERTVVSAQGEPLAWFQYGALAYELGNYQNAAAALEEAVRLNANYANALYMLALAYYQLDLPENALQAFERVADLNPDNQQLTNIVTTLRETGELPVPAQETAPSADELGVDDTTPASTE